MRPIIAFAATALLGAIGTPSEAGDLNPPGAPESTTGPEPRTAVNSDNTPGDLDSLYRIAQPGSYYLTSDVTGQSGKHGIEIAASDVTLDLNGFTLRGVAGSLNGITSNASNETILNGSVVNWGGVGIALGDGSRLEDIRAINNDIGCEVGDDCQVFDCFALENSSDGFRIGARAIIRGCVGSGNRGGSGFPNGFQVGGNSVITNCVAEGNESVGISCGFGCVIDSSAAIDNGYIGIAVSSHSTITDSISRGNHSGISTGNNSVVRGCAANENLVNGIWVAHNRCLVENNVCNDNGTGINVVGIHNRIDGNHVMENRNGVRIVGERNFVLRNTAGGNTGTGTPSASYDFEATFTSHGPIIFTGGEITTTNPWANFEYVSPL
jgi:hypothetical protein